MSNARTGFVTLASMRPIPSFCVALLLASLPLAGCSRSEKRQAEARAAIETTVRAYAEQMAAAYESQDATRLEGVATGREITGLTRRLNDLAGEGRRLSTTLEEIVFEEIDPYDATNATARTLERWDLRVVHADSGTVLSESLDQKNRVAYQLVRDRGRWLVMFRQLQQTVE